MRAFAQALDAVPLALAENSGLSPIDTLADVKSRQVTENNPRLGVDCMGKGENGEYCSITNVCAEGSAPVRRAGLARRQLQKHTRVPVEWKKAWQRAECADADHRHEEAVRVRPAHLEASAAPARDAGCADDSEGGRRDQQPVVQRRAVDVAFFVTVDHLVETPGNRTAIR